jgi:hypothetical protein
MTGREIDGVEWRAWFPVILSDTGRWTWLRVVWARKEFLGPRTAKHGDLDLMIWRYYRERPR